MPANRSVTEWIAAVPAELSAREALVFIQQALDDARDATAEVLGRFKGGTLPPPPWPQHALLRQAIDALEGGQKMLQQAIDAGYGDKKEKRDGPIGVRLVNGGRALYREIAVMQKGAESVKPEDLPSLAARFALHVAAPSIGGLLTFAAIVWILHNVDKLDRE